VSFIVPIWLILSRCWSEIVYNRGKREARETSPLHGLYIHLLKYYSWGIHKYYSQM
jgi:hypothetical protein